MSRYSKTECEFHDVDLLKECLGEMGLSFKEYATLTELEDYLGHKRSDTRAQIIVSRKNWSQPVNDVGFEYKEDGKVIAHLDDYFTNSNDVKGKFLHPLSARYAEKRVRKSSSRLKLRVSGEEKLADGTQRLRLRK